MECWKIGRVGGGRLVENHALPAAKAEWQGKIFGKDRRINEAAKNWSCHQKLDKEKRAKLPFACFLQNKVFYPMLRPHRT